MYWFTKILCGNPVYEVKFIRIECAKRVFMSHADSGAHKDCDLDDIEKYGFAIRAAKGLMGEKWFLTDLGIMVRGEARGLSMIHSRISVDDNLDFLSSFDSSKLRRAYAIPVHICGLYPEENPEENGEISSFGGFQVRFDTA